MDWHEAGILPDWSDVLVVMMFYCNIFVIFIFTSIKIKYRSKLNIINESRVKISNQQPNFKKSFLLKRFRNHYTKIVLFVPNLNCFRITIIYAPLGIFGVKHVV